MSKRGSRNGDSYTQRTSRALREPHHILALIRDLCPTEIEYFNVSKALVWRVEVEADAVGGEVDDDLGEERLGGGVEELDLGIDGRLGFDAVQYVVERCTEGCEWK
jgi:hypothetical protein